MQTQVPDSRIEPLIARLGSNHDGERMASLRALDRVLAKGGIGWVDLAARLQCDAVPAQAAIDAAYRRGWADASSRYSTGKPSSAAQVVEWLGRRSGQLGDKELQFIRNLGGRSWRGGDMGLTAKQGDWLSAIFARVWSAENDA